MANPILLNTFGQTHSEVVVSCSNCLDKYNNNFGDAKEIKEADEDGIPVGVRYIEKVCLSDFFNV